MKGNIIDEYLQMMMLTTTLFPTLKLLLIKTSSYRFQ